jgi:ParB family transcriptional regulator, chromosome partitioning protein
LETEIPLDSIEWNPYNSRLHYSDPNLSRLKVSLSKHGQLVPIKVRLSPKHKGKYELVYGHRRYLAAKNLGWKSIRANIVDATESQMIFESLIENLEREELSDFEKALTFKRLNKDFHLTYEQIGELLGLSKQHIGNYVAMSGLFDTDFLALRPDVVECLHLITEHHARILAKVKDVSARSDLLERIVKENISVRELAAIVGRLRSWFRSNEEEHVLEEQRESAPAQSSFSYEGEQRKQILSLITSKLRLIHSGDFKSVEDMQIFDESFSLFSAFPPFEKIEKSYAISRVRNWSYELAPRLAYKISDFKAEIMGDVAFATLTLSYSGSFRGRQLRMRAGGTIILVHKNAKWKIRHEHWSRLSGNHTDILESLEADRTLVLPRPT